MGFRFRKSVKFGPFRMNFSKKGIGYSVGGKGFRVTKKAGGGVRKTLSVPGTGISHVTETKKRKSTNSSKTKRKQNGQKGNAVFCVFFLILLAIIAFMWGK